MALQLVQVRDDLLSKLGIEAVDASTQDLQDVVVAINGAMQMLQTAGQDFFTREDVTLGITAGTAIYAFNRTIQAVLGPALWNNQKPLRSLSSRGEYDQFDRIFLGEATYGAAAGDPMAYWIENIRDGSTGDINLVQIWLAPTPDESGTLLVQVVNDAPDYVVADLDDTTEVPVAQNYTESVFLPIARMLVTRSAKFSRPDLLPKLTADYQLAIQRLGFVGGFPNAQEPKPPREVQA